MIDCEGTKAENHRAFYFHSKEAAVSLSNITVENGCDAKGGAVVIEAESVVKLAHCTFLHNASLSEGGGGVYNRGTADVTACIFNDNTCEGVAFGGAVYSDGVLTATKCVFSGNQSLSFDGGAFYNIGKATIASSQFIRNKAPRSGGAIISRGSMTIRDSTFTNNSSNGTVDDGGGGIDNNGLMTLTRCQLTSNSAGDFGYGGGIFNRDSLTLAECTVSNNTAFAGGGIYDDYTGTNVIDMINCEIIGNRAAQGGGIWNMAAARVTNCIFIGNIARSNRSDVVSEGGGSFNSSGTPQFTRSFRFCSFYGNQAQGEKAQGGALENDGAATLTNCTLWGNSAPNATEIGLTAVGNPMTTATYCDIQGGLSGTGNIKTNPGFIDAANGNLHLQAGSPCRGVGIAILPTKADPKKYDSKPDPGVLTDADGKRRPNPPSIGAYEYSASAPPAKKPPVLDTGGIAASDAAVPGAAPAATDAPPTAAALPNVPRPRPHLWPAEQQQENAAFLQLMVTLNTSHDDPADMAQKIQAELDKGADINARDSEGYPAIVTAASLSHLDVVQALLEHGADVNAATEQASKSSAADSASILHKTANGGYQVDLGEAISGLFAKKPKPLFGQTALMLAAQSGQAEMVTLLLSLKADVQVKDSRGKSAADYAEQNHQDSIAQTLKAQEAK